MQCPIGQVNSSLQSGKGVRDIDNGVGSNGSPQFEHHRAHDWFGLVGGGETGTIDHIPAPLYVQSRGKFHVDVFDPVRF